MPILKLEHDDENEELDFELNYQLSLPTKKRFDMMFEKSNMIKEMLIKSGNRKPSEIIKRK
jgi:hypothetical protein